MNPEGFKRLEEVFNAARELPPDEREAYLDTSCAGDAELRGQVGRLLEHDERSEDSFLEGTLQWLPSEQRKIPKQIGAYRIRRLLAAGGMGSVYLAVQEHPRRTVALKVMKHTIGSDSLLRRFEYESQILARLRHPHIAQVYDAGTHQDNGEAIPYFAMEYVPSARPITDYVTSHKLDTRQRLELFAKVCDAVHHGHQRGIIHRDLKPGNILVDASGEPKIIDFGVARATDSDMTITTLQTDIGQLIGTVQYMSPEQCEADPHDLDVRSDVYALGVLLYELLCERLPYDVTRAAMHVAARIIREQLPPKPSTVNRSLRGDIETITLKSLEKNRQRRYQSAADLAQDIDRYLHNEPIEARPASVIYQLRMMAKRNRTLFHSVAIIFLGLVFAVIGTSWGLAAATRAEAEATRQRDAAEAERDRADRLFRSGHTLARVAIGDFYKEIIDLPGTLPARQMIIDEALKYLESIERNAGDDVALQIDVAWCHRRIGQMIGGMRDPSLDRPREAIEHYEAALAINEAILATHPENKENRRGLVAGHLYYGDVLNQLRRRDEAMAHYQTALDISEALYAEEPDNSENRRLVAIAESDIGGILRLTEGVEAAEPHYARSLELRAARVAEEGEHAEALHDLTGAHIRAAELLRMKGDLRKRAGDTEGAGEQYRSALEHYAFVLQTREKIAEDDPYSTRRLRDVMKTHLLMAPVCNAIGDLDATAAHLAMALDIAERLYYCDSRDERTRKQLASTRRMYGYALVNAGDAAGGIAQLDAALKEYETLAVDFPEDARLRNELIELQRIRTDLEKEQDPQ